MTKDNQKGKGKMLKHPPSVDFESTTCLPDSIKPGRKTYRPVLEIMNCRYEFKDYEFCFTVDLEKENPYFLELIELDYYLQVRISETPAVNIDFYTGYANEKCEFLKKVTDAFELCELAPAILEDVKEAYKQAKILQEKQKEIEEN